ncbi:hypothetical protein B0H13DRAFT_1911285 [Mycena leptocephala]|nr:hypothetical protein B0H13DRAFT_1911285 [Mycena leptocephala]
MAAAIDHAWQGTGWRIAGVREGRKKEAQLLATQIPASRHTFVIPKARLHYGKFYGARLESIEEVYKKIRAKILTPGSEKSKTTVYFITRRRYRVDMEQMPERPRAEHFVATVYSSSEKKLGPTEFGYRSQEQGGRARVRWGVVSDIVLLLRRRRREANRFSSSLTFEYNATDLDGTELAEAWTELDRPEPGGGFRLGTWMLAVGALGGHLLFVELRKVIDQAMGVAA